METYILKTGDTLSGRLEGYNVIDSVGRGMTGQVYHIKGSHGKGRDFALKLFSPDLEIVADILEKLNERFQTEALALLNLNHKNVISVLDAGEDDFSGKRYSYYIMELCEKSLKDFIFQDVNQFCQVLHDICSGLKYIHSLEICHRDIKPSNIMLGKDESFKITDFGFAKVSDEFREILGVPKSKSTKKGVIIGDPDYVAPEVLRGNESDQRTDIFMLGKMFKKDLENVFFAFIDASGTKLERNKEETKIEFNKLVAKMLMDNPEDRYQNIEEMKEVLHNILVRLPEAFEERKKRMTDLAKTSIYLPAAITIKIPEQSNVPIPEKWLRLIDCREFQRLKKVRQLCTVIWVYPGADHNRFEHSLGAYHSARQVFQNLLRNDRIFSILDERAIEIFLASSLLHDLGHYPLSHVIEEVIKFEPYKAIENLKKFTHEKMLNKFIDYDDSELGDILRNLFSKNEIDIIKDLVSSDFFDIKSRRGIKWAFFKSLIDGPVDIDKIDYLEGDSIHCGVPYGKGFDKFRLISALTLNEKGDHLAISEKGRASLELFLLCRYTMFTEVYWHHATRAIMAMLKRVFLEFLGDAGPSVDTSIFDGYDDGGINKSILGENIWTANPYYYTDDESLLFLRNYAHSRGKEVALQLLSAIINGRYYKDLREDGIYKRIITFPYVSEDDPRSSEVTNIVTKIKLRIYSTDWKNFTNGVVSNIKERTGINDLEEHHIIFDVAKKEEKFDFQILYPKWNTYKDIKSASPIIKQLMFLFEKDANRHVRIFCHPKYWEQLSERRDDILEAIQSY